MIKKEGSINSIVRLFDGSNSLDVCFYQSSTPRDDAVIRFVLLSASQYCSHLRKPKKRGSMLVATTGCTMLLKML